MTYLGCFENDDAVQKEILWHDGRGGGVAVSWNDSVFQVQCYAKPDNNFASSYCSCPKPMTEGDPFMRGGDV